MDDERSKYEGKARKICAQQESSKSEIRRKLTQKGCPKELAEEISEFLEEEGWIDEDRLASEYVRSRSEAKSWGPIRIREGLKEKGLPEGSIEEALKEFSQEKQKKVLRSFLAKKWAEELRKGKEKARDKTIAAAERKGHPLPMILEIMEQASGPDSLNRIHPGSNESGE